MNAQVRKKLKVELGKLFEQAEVVYLDLEYIHETLAQNCRPKPHHWKEVVQFGAVKFNHAAGKEVDYFNRIVTPTVHVDKMDDSAWQQFEAITGLSKDAALKGEDFQLVWKDFQEFRKGSLVVVMLEDQDVLETNHKALRSCMSTEPRYIKLKPVLSSVDTEFNALCSGELYRQVSLRMEDVVPEGDEEVQRTHNGLFDARSMAWFVQEILSSVE